MVSLQLVTVGYCAFGGPPSSAEQSSVVATRRLLSTAYSTLAGLMFAILGGSVLSSAEPTGEGVSSREAKAQAIHSIPFHQLSPQTARALREVIDNPSFYRRMPSQTIQCDPDLFSFLVRRPEVMVNTWDLMGITKVKAKRTGPTTFLADDGVGTKCKCDLVYSDSNIHVYYGVGDYDGTMSARTVKGRAVCILRSATQANPQSHSGHLMRGTMDVFLKLDNFGADLLTRTFGPLVAKTADQNFQETAQFVSQLSQVCATNPGAALALADQLGNIDDSVRREFALIANKIGESQQLAQQNPLVQAAKSQNLAPVGMADTLADLKAAVDLTVPTMNLSDDPISKASAGLLTEFNSSRSSAPQQAIPPAGNNAPPQAIRPQKPNATMRR